MINFKTIKQFSKETGYTERAIRRKLERGIWSDNVAIKAPDGRILINIEGYNQWATQALNQDQTNQSRSAFNTKASVAGKRLNKSPAPIT